MKALLIMAHGSPRVEANDDVRAVAAIVRARSDLHVSIGYLDCNEPDIATALDACVAAGATSVTAVPYFLHSGKHLLRDIPALLEAASARHPHVAIAMGEYLGRQPEIVQVLRDRLEAVRGSSTS